MKYEEKIMDLFSVDNSYYLAHCISADFGMGKGIAVEFNKRFDMRNKLFAHFCGNYCTRYTGGNCVLYENTFNLITKYHYWEKPTYKSLINALQSMRDICLSQNINKLAMPKIGCGLDKLEWCKVAAIIQSVFADTDIEILVCKQ